MPRLLVLLPLFLLAGCSSGDAGTINALRSTIAANQTAAAGVSSHVRDIEATVASQQAQSASQQATIAALQAQAAITPPPVVQTVVRTVIVMVTPSPEPGHLMLGSLRAPQCGGGYAIENANVLVKNERGEIVGGGTTTTGDTSDGQCRVSFAVHVADARFYQVTVGTHGGPAYSYDEMQAAKWFVFLSLT